MSLIYFIYTLNNNYFRYSKLNSENDYVNNNKHCSLESKLKLKHSGHIALQTLVT
jgi:hypothetical protein